jgi:hypothetical protein
MSLVNQIKAGDIVIALNDRNGTFDRWQVTAMHQGEGKRWSYIVDWPLKSGQEPMMMETKVLLSLVRKAQPHERSANVILSEEAS